MTDSVIYCLYFIVMLNIVVKAQPAPQFTSVQACGVASANGTTATTSIITSPSGFIFTTGTFSGTVTFGSFALSSAGYDDVFVAKQDAATGTYLWVTRAGGALDEKPTGLALDSQGNVCLTGEVTSAQADFGSTIFSDAFCTGCPHLFVAKFSPNGTWLWANKSISSSYSSSDTATGLAVDANDAIYVVGSFDSRNLLLGNLTLTNTQPLSQPFQTGTPDLYVAKLSPSGTWLWAVSGGGTGRDEAVGIGLDASQNLYVAGFFESTSATFGPTTLSSTGYSNVVVAKLNSAGGWQQVTSGGSNRYTYPEKLAVASDGSIYITGRFTVSTTFGTNSLTSAGYYDVFVAKLSPAGTWLWASSGGGTAADDGLDIVLDRGGNTYITGYLIGPTADFGGTQLTNSFANRLEIFVAKLDEQGNWLWAVSAGGTGDDVGQCLALDNQGGLYLGGYYQSSLAIFGGLGLIGNQNQNPPYRNFGYLARLGNAVLATQIPRVATTFEVYPNPSQGSIWVKGLKVGQSVRFYNLAGQLVYSTTVPPNVTSPLLQPLQLSKGIYLMRSDEFTKKIVVE